MTTQSRRDWLDSLKVGDEVAAIQHGVLLYIAKVTHRTKGYVRTSELDYSATTGKALREWPTSSPPGVSIVPVTNAHRLQLKAAELANSIRDRTSRFTAMPTLEAMSVLIDWQHRPHVAAHAMEEIERVTRTEAGQ